MSPTAHSRKKGRTETGKSRDGEVFRAGRKQEREERWGPEAVREPGVPRAAAHAGKTGKGQRDDYLKGGGGVRNYRGPRCYMERRDVSNFGDPYDASGNRSANQSHSGRARGWDPGRAPEAVRNTHPGSRAVTQLSARFGDWVKGQPVVSSDAKEGCPKLDQGCPSAEDLEGAGCRLRGGM